MTILDSYTLCDAAGQVCVIVYLTTRGTFYVPVAPAKRAA